jgi:hypothetical protein
MQISTGLLVFQSNNRIKRYWIAWLAALFIWWNYNPKIGFVWLPVVAKYLDFRAKISIII